ncbi:hypothetical protein D915_005233 [Fasciola hepatica]|uniref:Reverse transcriptase domain-containing protein n=1 Tax=Fasciola hepatica TaxID=6192 RepID=A0A4E0RR22_FASHE|nr:hypothetical protein D915_005233 [Fasciola hepatica]
MVRSVPTSKRGIRRLQYAHVQKLYAIRRKDCAHTVLSGDWKEAHLRRSAPPPDLLAYWKGIFSQPSHLGPRPVQRPSAVHWSVLNTILAREVSEALRQMIPTAPGLDRLTVRGLLQMDHGCIAQLLNALLVLTNPTQHLSMARITLVPKCSNATGPGNYRPIAVTSIVLRLLHEILARRWRNPLAFSPWQMVFLQRDGCSEASTVLHTILRSVHQDRIPMASIFVDVSKAFDLVPHDTIIRAASMFGLPTPMANIPIRVASSVAASKDDVVSAWSADLNSTDGRGLRNFPMDRASLLRLGAGDLVPPRLFL